MKQTEDDGPFAEIKKLQEKQKKLISKVTTKTIKDEFEKIFEQFPDLLLVSFKCYTPSFNDGDPCYFNVSWDSGSDFWYKKEAYPESLQGDFDELCDTNPSDDPVENAKEMCNGGADLSLWRNKNDPWPANELAKVEKLQACNSAISKLLNDIPDEVMQSVFGDGVKVLITKDNVETTEYYSD
jgi:hypothetical protein